MSHRFYCPECRPASEVTLQGDQAAHLAKVLRAKPGQVVTLFDGKGNEFAAEVISAGRKAVRLRADAGRFLPRMPRLPLTIASAVPKGHRMDHLIELCAAYGVSRLAPIDTERSVASARNASDAKRERWERIVVETAKQCGRNVLMEINPMDLDDVLQAPGQGELRLVAAPGGVGRSVREALPAQKAVLALIGPEGGLADEELNRALAAKFQPVGLGEAILRIEHAAAALAAIACVGVTA